MGDWHAVELSELVTAQGPQRQFLTPAIAHGAQLSTGFVVMPPGHHAIPHKHSKYDIAIVVLEGNVMSLLGDQLQDAIPHKAGDNILIPAGMPHAGVNLSSTNRVVLIECRADPQFNIDVQLLPHLDGRIKEAAAYYQGMFVEPEDDRTVLDLL